MMMMMMMMMSGNAVPRSIPKIQYILIPSDRFLSFSEASILKKLYDKSKDVHVLDGVAYERKVTDRD